MNGITEKLLGIVSDWAGSFNGAFNIRENGQCAGRQSTAHIKIESKTDVPGFMFYYLLHFHYSLLATQFLKCNTR